MGRRSRFVGLVTISLAALPILGLTAAHTDYPPIVTSKTLFAKTDLRGKKAPAITVKKWLTGRRPHTKGKVVLVDFWATWCGPCRKRIPELAEWQKKFRKDLVVVGISAESADTVSRFMKTTRMPYYVGVDASRKTENVLGVQGLPHVLVISADGIVRWQGYPLDENDPLTTQKVAQIIKASKGQ